jgi:tRNA (guanine37-N1)-methyltransferase
MGVELGAEQSLKKMVGMKIEVITLFPELVLIPIQTSIMGRAIKNQKVEIIVHQLRDYGLGKYQMVDDSPYGGGVGMLLRPEPLFELLNKIDTPEAKIIYMSPVGNALNQKKVRSLAETVDHMIIICGHYEGIDQRVIEHWVDEEISIGDYVLTNGAIAATVLIDSVVRLLPGVLGDESSATDESFSEGSGLEYPQYTKPSLYEGYAVPEVLLSGNHAKIETWKKNQSQERTKLRRPDLLS